MDKMPKMGLGTFQIGNKEITSEEVILQAFRQGYRHFDLAANYGNLSAVANAFKKAMQPIAEGGLGIAREDFWITMKATVVAEAKIDLLLQRVGVAYFDLYLLHFPQSFFLSEDVLKSQWGALSGVDRKKLHRIGVSNFYEPHLDRLLTICDQEGLIRPYANEIEMHFLCKNKALMTYCQQEGMEVIAYSPLGFQGSGMAFDRAEVKDATTKLHCTPAQAILAYFMSQHVTVIPKSNHAERLLENFNAQQFVQPLLQQADVVETLDKAADIVPDGLLEDAIAAKQHGDCLEWHIQRAAQLR